VVVGGTVLVLIAAAGLNAPLALCAVSLAALNGLVELGPDFVWLGSPWLLVLALVLLVLQFFADLYFVPITVKDWRYLDPQRIHNAYLHARIQSLLRPLCAALLAAALLPPADWQAALLGFCGAAAVYWFSAWIREFVARTRGMLVLNALETAKNIVLVPLLLLAFRLPLLAIVLLVAMFVPVALWTARLQREHRLYAHYGGQRASEDA
jgi:hypothetical protein